MDGKPLYEYARQNIPLPKPIEARDCTIYNLELVSFKDGDEHSWTGAKEELSSEEKANMERLERLLRNAPKAEGDTAAPEAVAASTSTQAAEEPTASPSAATGEEETTGSAAEAESVGTAAICNLYFDCRQLLRSKLQENRLSSN